MCMLLEDARKREYSEKTSTENKENMKQIIRLRNCFANNKPNTQEKQTFLLSGAGTFHLCEELLLHCVEQVRAKVPRV